MMLVIIAIVLQLCITFLLPYIVNHFFPLRFNQIVVPIDTIFTLCGIILFIYIINTDMTVEGKLSWAVLVLLFPLLGIICYFIFIRRKAPKKHRKYYKKVAEDIKPFQVRYDDEERQLREALGDRFDQFEYIFKTTGFKTFDNTEVKYLRMGEIFFEELKEELNKAERYIFMEYFIIERGKMWDEIVSILKKKVKAGVEVRVMYDDLGTIKKLPSNFARKLTKSGIKCVKFNSFIPIVSAVHNNRDHRKITVIDGKVGFVSGLNIADEYINVVQKYGTWKDTGVKLKGSAVKNLLMLFMQLYCVQNQRVEDFSTYFSNEITAVNSSGYVCPYGDGPKYLYNENIAENVYLNMIYSAKKYLWITTPYLILDNRLTTALCSAARRGVDVRIVTPHIPDKKIIFKLTRSNYKVLLEAGVKILEYSKGFIHSKQVLCDDDLAIVGTINFDYRSLLHHYEVGVLMYKTDCLISMKSDFNHIFTDCIDMKNFKQKTFTRLLCAIIKIFTPML